MARDVSRVSSQEHWTRRTRRAQSRKSCSETRLNVIINSSINSILFKLQEVVVSIQQCPSICHMILNVITSFLSISRTVHAWHFCLSEQIKRNPRLGSTIVQCV